MTPTGAPNGGVGRRTTRRRLLRGVAASVGIASLGGLSGCSALAGGGQPAYASWLPALDVVYADEGEESEETQTPPLSTEYLPFQASTYDGVADYETETGRTYAGVERDGSVDSVLDAWPEDVAFRMRSSLGFQVTETELEQDRIAAAYEEWDDELEREQTDDETVRLRNSDESWVITVEGGRVVEAWEEAWRRPLRLPRRIVEGLRATGAGSREGLVETDDGVATLTDRLGSATALNGRAHERVSESDPEVGQFRGQVASGEAWTVDGSTTELQEVFVFDADAEVPVEEVEAYADPDREPETGAVEGWADVSVTTGDRTVVVEGQMDTSEAFHWSTPT